MVRRLAHATSATIGAAMLAGALFGSPAPAHAVTQAASAQANGTVGSSITRQAIADASARATCSEVRSEAQVKGMLGDFSGTSATEWCSGYARFVWHQAGVSFTNELTAHSGSFYTYGRNHGTLDSNGNAHVGDAVLYGGTSDSAHVGLVTAEYSDGTFDEVDGNTWDADPTRRVLSHRYSYDHRISGNRYGITPSCPR